jgi:putative transposase
VWKILKAAGIDTAPRRSGPTWRQILATQAHAIVTVDSAQVDTVFLRRSYVLIAIEHGRRRAHIAGITAHPTPAWATPQARNLLMDLGTRAAHFRFLIRDRGSTFTATFDAAFTGADIRTIRTPVRAPRANAITERFIGTLRREYLDHLLITGPRHLTVVLHAYLEHYNAHRLTGRYISSRPQATLPHPPKRPLGRYDETGGSSCTSMSRSHDDTGFSAPTGMEAWGGEGSGRFRCLVPLMIHMAAPRADSGVASSCDGADRSHTGEPSRRAHQLRWS